MKIAEASVDDCHAAYAVLRDCRLALEAQGLMQWGPQYPNLSFFSDAIARKSLFALSENGRIGGVVVLDESQAPEWSAVAWQIHDVPFLVIHTFAIAPPLQGRGYGKQLLRFCEALARDRGYSSVRLDAFSENSAALHFYEQRGYVFRSEIQFASKPAGHQRYYCYEKDLRQKTGETFDPTFVRKTT